jgi:hypothetical protein
MPLNFKKAILDNFFYGFSFIFGVLLVSFLECSALVDKGLLMVLSDAVRVINFQMEILWWLYGFVGGTRSSEWRIRYNDKLNNPHKQALSGLEIRMD